MNFLHRVKLWLSCRFISFRFWQPLMCLLLGTLFVASILQITSLQFWFAAPFGRVVFVVIFLLSIALPIRMIWEVFLGITTPLWLGFLFTGWGVVLLICTFSVGLSLPQSIFFSGFGAFGVILGILILLNR